MNRRLGLGLTLAAAACSQPGIRVPPPLSVVIGPQGGELSVGNGQILLTVPAGALAADVRIGLGSGWTSPLLGWIEPGLPYEFSPGATSFALPSQFVIPYNPGLVASAVMPEEIRVGWRNAAGVVTALTPTFTDPDGRAVSFDSLALGTFWVVAPDVVAAPDLFPLNDGDTYHYDTGLVLTVTVTTAEPNLALSVAKLAFTQDGRTSGFYLGNVQVTGQLQRLGEFDAERQEVLAAPALLVGPRDPTGATRTVLSSVSGYQPFGSTTPAWQGSSETTTAVVAREVTSVPRGDFNTVRVLLTVRFQDNRPGQGTEQTEFWFAKGVGPVAIRLDGAIQPVRLVSATVGGLPVAGS